MEEKEFVEKIRQAGGRIFIVGGWVRDTLRGAVPKDKDYVVVVLSAETFLRLFPVARQVGRGFPVYLLRIDGKSSEIAFARRERKTGPGYRGFAIEAAPAITIEEDLYRRDTTMNSIAMELPERQLLDPYGGRLAIEERRIAAVSGHFCEDPVRALRAARQAAELGFSITDETFSLMRRCQADLLQEPPERLQQELERALQTERPSVFFQALERAGLLTVAFPELAALVGRQQPVEFHPEGDAFVHSLLVLDKTAAQTTNAAARFAALVHDLGKGTTPHSMEPHHYGHEERGLAELARWNARGRLPRLWVQCAALVIREHMRAPRLAKPGKIVALLLQVEQSPLALDDFLAVIRSDHGPLPAYLEQAAVLLPALQAVSGRDCPAGLRGAAVGQWVREAQVRVCQAILPQLESAGK